MRKAFLLWLLFGVYAYGYSQIITIKDIKTQYPLEMVALTSLSPKAFTTTNRQGQADLSIFRGAIRIEIRTLGFKTEVKSYADLEKAEFILLLTPSFITMDEIVVSATRWSQVSNDNPSKITAISAREVYLQNPQTAADLLGATGEVFIQKSQQGGGSPMIRGFSTNRLLYVIDGVRMNTAIFRSGNLQNVISLDPLSIEKSEVLFGPGSVIYGSDAIGGVMSFQTITPQLSYTGKTTLTGKALTRYSSANSEKTAHFNINVGGKRWASVTSMSSSDFGDLRMGTKGPDEYLRPFYVQRIDGKDVAIINDDPLVQKPSGYSQINMMQKIRFQPNKNWDLQYGFHYSETSGYSRYDRHIRYKNGLPRYGEWSYGPQKWMMNNLSIAHNGNNPYYDQMTIRLAQQWFEESRIDRDINKAERHIRIENVGAYSANLDFNKSLGSRHQLFYGVEGVLNDVTSVGIDRDITTGISATGPARYPQSTWGSYGAYLSYEMKVTERFLVHTGARYNQYTLDALFDTKFYPFPYTTASMNDGALTGSLGVILHPTEKWTLRANVSTGFRAPNVDDMGKVFDSEPGAVVIPNPDLKAEYAYNAEIGIAKVFDDIVKIDFSGYYTLLQNAMVRRDYQLNGEDSILYDGTMSQVQAVQNAAMAYVYGIQTGIDVKLPYGFSVTSDFNFQIGKEELDNGSSSPSRHAPPAFGTSSLVFTTGDLYIKLYAVYSGGKDFEELPEEEKGKTEIYAIDQDGNPYSPGWYTLNFKAMYQFAEHFSVSAGLENLTDQRYRPYSSGIVAPGRNLVLSLRATF
jgi:hemoglobin/transferrin/lactoferrin receptor protein